MAEKLIIDLAKAEMQSKSNVRCSYKHHPENKGFDSLLEMIRFALICRKCESAPCINACPQDALEKIPSGNNDAGRATSPKGWTGSGPTTSGCTGSNPPSAGLKRANMLCTGCGTCAIACPFGTIYTDLIPYPSSVCDRCKGRLAPGEKPLCVQTCTDGSIDYGHVKVEGDLVEVFEDIVVKVAGGTTWQPFLRDTEKAKK